MNLLWNHHTNFLVFVHKYTAIVYIFHMDHEVFIYLFIFILFFIFLVCLLAIIYNYLCNYCTTTILWSDVPIQLLGQNSVNTFCLLNLILRFFLLFDDSFFLKLYCTSFGFRKHFHQLTLKPVCIINPIVNNIYFSM
jgi:hypothetical protein